MFNMDRIMLMVFVVTTILTDFNTTTDITARQPKNEWITKSPGTVYAGNVNTTKKERGRYIVPLSAKDERITKSPGTVYAGNVNTTKKERGRYIVPLSAKDERITKSPGTVYAGNVNTTKKERGRYIVPLSAKGTKTSIDHESGYNTKNMTAVTKSQAGTHMGKDEFSTKNEQENSTVPTMHSNYSHHQDNSKIIGIIVGLTATFFLLVVIIVVVLCYYKKLLCFKRNEKCDEETPSIPMLNGKNKKADEPVGEDTVLIVKVENNNTPDTIEDEVDISSAKTNSPVCVYVHTSKYSNIQPTSNDENVKVLATCM